MVMLKSFYTVMSRDLTSSDHVVIFFSWFYLFINLCPEVSRPFDQFHIYYLETQKNVVDPEHL